MPPANDKWQIAEPERGAELTLQPRTLCSEIRIIDSGRLADGDPDGTRDRRSAGRPPLSQPNRAKVRSHTMRVGVGVERISKLTQPPDGAVIGWPRSGEAASSRPCSGGHVYSSPLHPRPPAAPRSKGLTAASLPIVVASTL